MSISVLSPGVVRGCRFEVEENGIPLVRHAGGHHDVLGRHALGCRDVPSSTREPAGKRRGGARESSGLARCR